jgi:DNA modification methylase
MSDNDKARLILTDEPYNVPIAGHVTGGAHREFLMASGEMTHAEFQAFNTAWIGAALPHLHDGGLFGTFIDWRGYPAVITAALQLDLIPINLIVWAKTNAGMGSLYRSQHELLPLFKKGNAPHINNVQLGKNGRWRSNVWSYPGASSLGSDARQGLQEHPTVKPVAMLEDALLDVTERGDIVLDPFLGSGSTLIACEKTGRRCRGLELDPLYVEVILRRYEAIAKRPAVLESTGETYAALAERRRKEDTNIPTRQRP